MLTPVIWWIGNLAERGGGIAPVGLNRVVSSEGAPACEMVKTPGGSSPRIIGLNRIFGIFVASFFAILTNR